MDSSFYGEKWAQSETEDLRQDRIFPYIYCNIGGATYRRGQSFVPTFNAILGVRLIHECDLYSRQYGTQYTLVEYRYNSDYSAIRKCTVFILIDKYL